MIGVIAHWEDLDNLKDLKHLWKDTVKPLYATHLYFVDKDGTAPKELDLELEYKTFPSLEEALKEHTDVKYVFVEAERSIPKNIKCEELNNFLHPVDNVFYIFGSDAESLSFKKLPLKDNYVVFIKTFYNYSLWSLVAAGIVLYDRYMKV